MNEALIAPSTPPWRAKTGRGAYADLAQRGSVGGLALLFAVYLGLSGGGYDIIVRSEIGLVVWWFLLLGGLIATLPRARIPAAGWAAGLLLGGFLVWSWVGLTWSSSHEQTLDAVCRLSTYLGFFLIGLCVLTPGTVRSLITGLGLGIALVCLIAVLSKLTPTLFPADAQGNVFYETARLAYPFNYADGVGEYAALGIPPVLLMATGARTALGRALSTAALQPVLLCLAMTVSRGGILAAVVGLVVFLALAPDRIPRLTTLAITAAGIALLMLALLHRPALRDSLSAAPAAQRHSMLLILCLVTAGVAMAQGAATLLMKQLRRPRWLIVSRRGARLVTAAIVALVAAVVIVGFASGAAAKLWHDFKLWQPQSNSNEYFRLFSVAGSHRYQYWQIAWRAFTGSPLHGIGSGNFQFYWLEHSRYIEKIINAHSLWFETLAETGIIGWLLLAGFFGLVMIRGVIRALNGAAAQRALMAAAVAAVFAFCAAASFDWTWQIGVIPMVTLLLAAATFVIEPRSAGQPAASGPRASSRRPAWRRGGLLLVPAAVLAMILIAVPLASSVAVRASQSAARRGDLSQALADANTAQAIEPGAATPYLQQALVLEQANDIAAALPAMKRALAAQPDDYVLWLVADRLETEADHPRRALADYRRALVLWPAIPTQVG